MFISNRDIKRIGDYYNKILHHTTEDCHMSFSGK